VRAEGGRRDGRRVIVLARGDGGDGTLLCASRQRCRGDGSKTRCLGLLLRLRLRLGLGLVLWPHGRGYLGSQGRAIDTPCGGGTERGHLLAGAGGGGGGVHRGIVAHLSGFLQDGRKRGSHILVLILQLQRRPSSNEWCTGGDLVGRGICGMW
jgi:hypothetical protein